MARLMSRRTRRTIRKLDDGVQDVKGYIEQNPLTAAVLALAAGVIGTSVVKMTVGKLNEPKKPKEPKKPRAKRAGGKSPRKAK